MLDDTPCVFVLCVDQYIFLYCSLVEVLGENDLNIVVVSNVGHRV